LLAGNIKYALQDRWRGPGGCAAVLSLAFPLILSTGSYTVQMFVDRMFLMWYSSDAMSAALPAGILAFTFVSFFMGTVSYVNTFVAQYTGAERHGRVGPAVWQGIYLALIGSGLIICLIPTAPAIFNWMGHEAAVRENEIVYFKIMCLGVTPVLVSSAISGFFTGRGKTWIVLYVNIVDTLVNIVLDYCLIFGNFGFPRMGIAGAAWGTIIAAACSTGMYIYLFLIAENRRKYATFTGKRVDLDLFGRLLRYGMPNGVQFMLDILAFTLFIAFIGRIDKTSLAATNIAFQIDSLAFMPMIGMGIALTAMVGQALGKNKPQLAQRATWSAFLLTYSYMALIAAGYWLVPELFLFPIASGADPAEFAAIEPLIKNLLCFVAVYCLFDTGNIIFSAALKGAGDTRFVMMISVLLSWVIMVLPSYLAIRFGWGPGDGLYLAWGFTSAYVCILAVVFLLRFLHGKWKTMRVIEAVPAPVLPGLPEVPTMEVDTS